jgi:hypothetical protein
MAGGFNHQLDRKSALKRTKIRFFNPFQRVSGSSGAFQLKRGFLTRFNGFQVVAGHFS